MGMEIDATQAIAIAKLAAEDRGCGWKGEGFVRQASVFCRIPLIGDGTKWIVSSTLGRGKRVDVYLTSTGEVLRVGFIPR